MHGFVTSYKLLNLQEMHIHVLQYTVYPVNQSVVVDVKITEVMWIQYKLY